MSPLIECYQGYVQLKNNKPSIREDKVSVLSTRKKRGRISEFSDESRKRLHRETLKIKFSADFFFVTLTYQASKIDLQTKEVEWKNDLKKLKDRLYHSSPSMSFLWKLEFTKLGVPHYHLITHCPECSATELRNEMRKHWISVTGSGSRGRHKHAVKVDHISNITSVTRYMAKYVSKDAHETEQEYVGKYWGYLRKSSFPSGTLDEHRLSKIELEHIRRVLACVYVPRKFNRVRKNITESNNGFAVYIPYHIQSRLFSTLRRSNEPF